MTFPYSARVLGMLAGQVQHKGSTLVKAIDFTEVTNESVPDRGSGKVAPAT